VESSKEPFFGGRDPSPVQRAAHYILDILMSHHLSSGARVGVLHTAELEVRKEGRKIGDRSAGMHCKQRLQDAGRTKAQLRRKINRYAVSTKGGRASKES
jgi:hypothetical protein